MATSPTEGNGFARRRPPPIPFVVVGISLIVAVGAVTALIFVLFKTTTGPGQSLRVYYQAVSAGDCDSAFARLSASLKKTQREAPFCSKVHRVVRNGAPEDVEIKAVTGFGEPPARFARVTVEEIGTNANPQPIVWKMVREGGSWYVAEFPDTGRCEVKAPPRHCVPL
jgi:hypothetical protein